MPPDHPPGFDNRLTFGTGRSHYALEIGGKRILYAYIRKNGCSAFKTAMGLASDVSIGAARRLRAGPFGRYDARIFVWRDPEERLVSLYRNKILDRKNAEDLIRRYREVMHEEPSSFERFALFATTGADPHLIAQRHHLRPIRCTPRCAPLSGPGPPHRSGCRSIPRTRRRSRSRPMHAPSSTASTPAISG